MDISGNLLKQYLSNHDVACPECGYNLRGGESALCPECGSELELTVGAARSSRRSRAAAVMLLAFLVALGGLELATSGQAAYRSYQQSASRQWVFTRTITPMPRVYSVLGDGAVATWPNGNADVAVDGRFDVVDGTTDDVDAVETPDVTADSTAAEIETETGGGAGDDGTSLLNRRRFAALDLPGGPSDVDPETRRRELERLTTQLETAISIAPGGQSTIVMGGGVAPQVLTVNPPSPWRSITTWQWAGMSVGLAIVLIAATGAMMLFLTRRRAMSVVMFRWLAGGAAAGLALYVGLHAARLFA